LGYEKLKGYKMGCGGSKDEAVDVKENHENPSTRREIVKKEEPPREEEEVLVLQAGKTMPKNKLDELTENTSVNKTVDRSVGKIEVSQEKHYEKQPDLPESKAKTIVQHKNEEVKIDATETGIQSIKAATLRVGFENHPHEFDFSFIDENPKVENDHDKLAEEVLKEISDLD
jgi:hypothetical protein